MAADPITSSTVDELFDFGPTDDEDPFKDKKSRNARDNKTTLSPRPAKRKAGDIEEPGADLGLDEEVKITKKRKPIAKLDEARLLSAPGIPKLRTLARSGNISKKLRLKGKGHEFNDVAKLLNHYQLWLDNLYPRAKFADGLQLVEKVGHSKRMQVIRKEWIDEGKPGYVREKLRRKEEEKEKEIDDLYAGDTYASKDATATVQPVEEDDSLFVPDARGANKNSADEDALPEDDELDALLAEQDNTVSAPRQTSKIAEDLDSEGEDDLDALLAAQETRKVPPPVSSPKPITKSQRSPFDEEDDDEDMDDLDALLAEQDTRSKPITTQPTTNILPHTSPENKDNDLIPDDHDDDDLDAVLAEQEVRHESARPQSTGEALPQPPTSTHAPTSNAEPQVNGGHNDAAEDAFEAENYEQSRENEGGDGEADFEAGDMFSSSPVQGD
ncbi:chromosome segregation in meiosis-related protein [Elasticomyces elasticus]|uniref:Chromosome segregation in meiosis protein n=1 Tax=Exophiala sideris TaxID=1016849 RepID=A0ABR0J842_9EURO|nr:chromosome segregation in meiosis-related protein [Elasticomyces elasticus]KAK5028780.1 chromosome segregation in meiosis- protein [Exophiala sideris]KAK5035649.1 chromosome segregation in meiosis-related protein [Exophiala sideris]KAK5057284.1 chromosome segregation in meiosis- protein [Exophiala sideris]KAK5181743.1 chromosome segregation in meiosis- protein [Eurotiomycetes sp. CCFEE 6388]